MATNQDEKADGRLLKTSFDGLFIVRSPLEINELANVKNQENGNRSKPCDTLAQPAPESTAERLAQKPTSGRASSPAGSPKPTDTAAPSAGVSVVNYGKARYDDFCRRQNAQEANPAYWLDLADTSLFGIRHIASALPPLAKVRTWGTKPAIKAARQAARRNLNKGVRRVLTAYAILGILPK